MTSTHLNAQLKQYTEGLWLPSETEAPWTVPSWTLSEGDDAEILRVLRRNPQTPIAEISLADLRTQVQRRCQGYGAEGKAIARQHQELFDFLQQQCDRLRVLRVGTVTIDIVIVGATTEGYIALQTQSVET